MKTTPILNHHTQIARKIDRVDDAVEKTCDDAQYIVFIFGLMILAVIGIMRLLKPKEPR